MYELHLLRVKVHHRRPEHGAALDGRNSGVEVGKARPPPMLWGGEVHEEGVYARTLRREVARVLVMVDLQLGGRPFVIRRVGHS